MKPRYCEVPHDPPHSYGDCIRACVATIIDRDDVPHVFDDDNIEEGWRSMRSYLASHGKFMAIFAIDDEPHEFMRDNNANIPYILIGSSLGKVDHAVVCRDDRVIHDPGYTAITQPHSQGFYVVIIIADLIK